MKAEIKHCPTCGSTRIRRVKKDWAGESSGEKYVVTDLVFDECPACNERIFDRDAVHRIQERSPAFTHLRRKAA
jgi:YgiT-type zinc finger domain-containing protein